MYKSLEEAKSFAIEVQEKAAASEKLEAVICPPALYLSELVQITKGSAVGIGAQTMHDVKEGAFTALVMLSWVILSVVNTSTKQMNPSTRKSMQHLTTSLRQSSVWENHLKIGKVDKLLI